MTKDLLNSDSEDFWRWWYTKPKNSTLVGISYFDGKNYSRSFRKRF